MEVQIISLTNSELSDIYIGLVIAMKELDKHSGSADQILSNRIEILLEKLESQIQ